MGTMKREKNVFELPWKNLCTSGQRLILILFNMNISTKQNHLLEVRSTLYGAVSALFSDPESEKFAMLFTPKIQGCVFGCLLSIGRKEGSK